MLVVSCSKRFEGVRLIPTGISLEDAAIAVVALIACAFAGQTTLAMGARARSSNGLNRQAWFAAAGMTLGGGVWILEFAAAFVLWRGLPTHFDPQIATLSLFVATIGIWTALAAGSSGTRNRAAIGGIMIAVTICVSGYLASQAFLGRDPPIFDDRFDRLATLVLLAAVVGATLTLRGARRAFRTTAVLALGVVGLHFAVYAALCLLPDWQPLSTLAASQRTAASAMVVIGLLVMALSLVAAVIDKQIQRRAAGEVARMRRFADVALEGIVFHDQGRVVDASAAFCRLVGRDASDLIGMELARCFTAATRAAVAAFLRGGGEARIEAALADIAGRECAVELRTSQIEADEGMLSILAVRDITERKEAEELLRRVARFDGLTGLANRAMFRERLAHTVGVADGMNGGFAVLVIGLDRFKIVNDTFGIAVGDGVLAAIADRFRAVLRENDTLARLGGDEFGIILASPIMPSGDHRESAALLTRRLLQTLRPAAEIEGQSIPVSASIGVAFFPEDAQAPELLLSHAALALERAKKEGRNTVRFFESGSDEKLQVRHELEAELRLAASRGEITLAYQPLFGAADLDIEGYEALARWDHPRFGRVPPSEFIPIAEDAGIIEELGAWILGTACAEAASWPDQRRIAVNLSPLQCRNPDFPARLRTILDRTGLDPGRLELEITEGVLIQDPERALSVLRGCKAVGVRLALDDFGTGYSSLSYLRRFPVDKIKIDRSFITELGKDAEADAIVASILVLGRSLHLDITAEGVETEEQLAYLQANGATQIQGYFLARPIPAEEIGRRRGKVTA